MAYDLEEQEQLDTLKAWWKQYGNLITWLLIIALGAYAAWAGWNMYQRKQVAQAAALYEELQKAVIAKDAAKVQRAASDLKDTYGRTAYAQMAALTAAKSAFEADQLDVAKSQLSWVAEHGERDYQAIAKIRLAGVLLDQKAYEDALKALSGEFPAYFAAAVADRKGDILLAQNKIDEARAAYREALEKTDANDPGRQLIQVKLDAIGGSAPAA